MTFCSRGRDGVLFVEKQFIEDAILCILNGTKMVSNDLYIFERISYNRKHIFDGLNLWRFFHSNSLLMDAYCGFV